MEHVRIDEGMKRGPRKKPGPKPSSPRRDNGQFLEKLPNDPEAIRSALEAYQYGATLQQIAEAHKVTKQAIYGWLLGELGGEQHSMLVTKALTSRIANADERLDTADNPLDLQRGREQARNARLDLERRRSHLYGQKQELTVKAEIKMEGVLDSLSQSILERIRTIDVSPVPSLPQLENKDA